MACYLFVTYTASFPKMEAICSFETPENIHQTLLCHDLYDFQMNMGVCCIILPPSWRRRQCGPLKLSRSPTRLHGIITQWSPTWILTWNLNTLYRAVERPFGAREQRSHCSVGNNTSIAPAGKCSSVNCFPLSSCKQFLRSAIGADNCCPGSYSLPSFI
jgi:hypothetical protein